MFKGIITNMHGHWGDPNDSVNLQSIVWVHPFILVKIIK